MGVGDRTSQLCVGDEGGHHWHHHFSIVQKEQAIAHNYIYLSLHIYKLIAWSGDTRVHKYIRDVFTVTSHTRLSCFFLAKKK